MMLIKFIKMIID